MCLKLTETAYLKAQVVQEHNCDRSRSFLNENMQLRKMDNLCRHEWERRLGTRLKN